MYLIGFSEKTAHNLKEWRNNMNISVNAPSYKRASNVLTLDYRCKGNGAVRLSRRTALIREELTSRKCLITTLS